MTSKDKEPVSLEIQGLQAKNTPAQFDMPLSFSSICKYKILSWEDDSGGINKVELYREILSGIPDCTRQRDFKELEELGYEVWYERGYEDEPGRWHYEIPGTYELKTIPRMKPMRPFVP